MLRQLAVTARSIHHAAAVTGDTRRAAQLNDALRDQLRQVRDTYVATERSNALQQLTLEQQATAARAQTARGRPSPLPTPLTPQAESSTVLRGGRPDRGHDFER